MPPLGILAADFTALFERITGRIQYPTFEDELDAVASGRKAFSANVVYDHSGDIERVERGARERGLVFIYEQRPSASRFGTLHFVFACVEAERWRAPAYIQLFNIMETRQWNYDFALLHGRLLGYTEEEITTYLDDLTRNGVTATWRGRTMIVLCPDKEFSLIKECGMKCFHPSNDLSRFVFLFRSSVHRLIDDPTKQLEDGFVLLRTAVKGSFATSIGVESRAFFAMESPKIDISTLNNQLVYDFEEWREGRWCQRDPYVPTSSK